VWVSRAAAARLRVEQEALLRRARQLEYDALSDPLTRVPNRRAFDANLPRLVGDAQAAGSPLTLAIIDVDRFKRVNDTHGHLVGDEVLRTVARLLREHTRDADRCARYGGDEFVLCLPAGRREAAAAVARIIRAVAAHPWSQVVPGLRVTVTAGLAELGPTDTSTTLFWSADQSLLAAKRSRPPAPRGSG
jgi:diguanylate cyclase (GGDEF)-like protein